MSFPRYPVYKDSEIDWLGNVPPHWNIVQTKRLFQIVGGSTPKSDNDSYWDGDIVWITPADLSQLRSFEILNSARRITADGLASCGTTMVPKGNIVLSTRAPIGSLGISDVELCTNQGCKCLIAVNRLDPRFYAYMFSIASTQLNIRGKGTTFLELSGDALAAFELVYPPHQEQSSIAAFLDRETAKIDALVAEQEKLIELLKEKRQAVISHAVTKGLDPNVPMKDSGVEWMGEVPEHWAVMRLRHFADVLRGKFTHRPRNDPAYYDGEYPFIQTGDITSAQRFITSYKQTLNELGASVSKEFPKGTLVMAIAANIGDVAILDFPAFFPDSIVGLAPHEGVDLFFLYRLMQAMKSPMLMTATISTQMNLNVEQIISLSAPRPPLVEQKAIVEHIDAECSALEEMTFEAQRAIDLLEERRSALISAAVTGKIDVRGLVKPSPDNAPEKP